LNEGGRRCPSNNALEAMDCAELLKELARLTTERDHIHSQVGTPT
jgi:hypothetical protein